MSFKIKENLIKNNSITFHKNISNWKKAIQASLQVLIDKKVCTQEYFDSIIESTIKFGPYYIICPQVAMPHGEMGKGVNENGITLSIFDQDIIFPKENKVRILVCLCGKNSEVHTGEVLPQIAALFENENNIQAILKCKNKDEVIAFLNSLNLSKYLNK